MGNIKEVVYGNIKLIQKSNYKWGVTNLKGREIVSFGKYDWIDNFDSGLARVKIKQDGGPAFSKWGIIDDRGVEVLPVKYNQVWKFAGRNRRSTIVVKDGIELRLAFDTLQLTPIVKRRGLL